MKTKTEKILTVLKIIALLGGIGYSIECGSKMLSFAASFINADWAKHVYMVDPIWFALREHNILFYSYIMLMIIAVSALKATVWYVVLDLLTKLRLRNPFSIEVEKKLEKIAYLLLGVWIISIIGRIYIDWLSKSMGITLTGIGAGDEYLFVSGIVYIISQVFKRGIEIQSENELTV